MFKKLNLTIEKIIRIIGFVLLIIGAANILLGITFGKNGCFILTSDAIAINFFVIMLGVSLIFPELLQDRNQGLSTMRITVFMMINVICMLLLRLGWNAKSLGEIGLDANWMGIIAFIFGAKATQTYFESKKTAPKDETATKAGVAALEFTNADIAKLAVEQNQQFLKVKFPNIVSISEAIHDLNQTQTHVIAICLNDNNEADIPNKLEVKMPDGSVKTIPTEIIKEVGEGN